MKAHKNNPLTSLLAAWKELFDFTPEFIKDVPALPDGFTAPAFPLLGLIIGSLLSLTATLFLWCFNFHAGVIFFTVAAWVVISFKDSGRGDMAAGERLQLGKSQSNGQPPELLFSTIALPILRFVLLLILAYAGGIWFLPLLLAGAFGLQAALATAEEAPAIFPDKETGRKVTRFILVATALCSLFFSRNCTIAAVAAFTILYAAYSSLCRRKGFSPENISRAGYAAEWALLVAGIIAL